jgi:hypothetical protein
MARVLVCSLVSLLMVVGVADAKKSSGKTVKGTFVSYKHGTLTIATRAGQKHFKVAHGTSVHVGNGGAAKATKMSAPAGLEKVSKGTPVHVHLKNGKVVRVTVNPSPKKKKQQP